MGYGLVSIFLMAAHWIDIQGFDTKLWKWGLFNIPIPAGAKRHQPNFVGFNNKRDLVTTGL